MNNLDTLTNIIESRRSVFTPMMSGGKIPDDVIFRAIKNANWAPNHKQTEPWRFYIIQDEGLKRLSEYSRKWYLENTPEEKFSERKLKKTTHNALLSSHVIAIVMQRDENKSVPEWEEIAAVSMAVQNIWLSISAAGYGCYWSTPKYALDVEAFIPLKEGERCLGFLYLGVPVDGLIQKGERQDIGQKVTIINK